MLITLAILPYLIGIFAISTALVLVAGLMTMASSQSAHDKYGNLLMRWRVGLQGVTLALIALSIGLKNLS